MPLKLKSIIDMDKRKKKYVFLGGIWGLINVIIIYQFLWMWSFGGIIWENSFEDMLFLKIIFLPAYLTDQLIIIPLIELDSSISDSSPPFLILLILVQLVAIVMPILFGIGISLLTANLINKGKKVLRK